MFAPNHRVNWLRGVPVRSAAGTTSMLRRSTVRNEGGAEDSGKEGWMTWTRSCTPDERGTLSDALNSVNPDPPPRI